MTNVISISERFIKYSVIFAILLFVLPITILLFTEKYIGFTTSNYNFSLAFLSGLIVGLPSLLVWILFSNPVTYWLICGGLILFVFISFCWGKSVRSNKILALFLIMFIPIGMIAPYYPAVQASNGYLMISATQPVLFERGLKNLQVLGEVTPCVYSLLGWKDQLFFYKEICGTNKKLLQFDLTTLNKSSSSSDIKDLVVRNIPHTNVLNRFKITNVTPIEAEFWIRELNLRGDAMTSPDGKWIAIIARHIYGPEDVLLVTSQSN